MHTAPFRSASCPTPPLGGARPYSLRSLGVLLGILFGVLALLSAGARPARAATYQVTTLADDGSAGSLRAAITSANGSAGTTITFAPGLKGTITLGSDLPALTNNMSIQGPGASVIAVDGNGKYQPFVIYPSVTAALSGLTIQNGNAGTFSGGGVFNAGTLTLTGCALAGNHADGVGGVGGGVYNDVGGTLTLTGCTLTGNSAGDGGGGVYNVGTVTLTGCTLTGNRAVNAGGGVFNAGTLTLTGCTLTGNSAGDGGGVYNNSGTVTLTGCTLTGNSAQDSGGGVYNVGTVTLTDDIFYGDSASTGPEFDGSITATYCDFQGLSAAPDSTHNFGADPLLAPLGDYGGPTQTFALLPGSPCLGTGTNAGLSADQRGVPIPQGGRYDIGAFESRGFKVAVTGGSPQSATAGTAFAQSLTAAVTANVSPEPVAGGVLTFTGPASGASATFSPDPATIGSTGSAAVTATANGVIGGPYSVTADTGAGSAVYSLTNTVATAPPVVTTQPQSQTVTAGQTATFTAAATGKPTPTVQWQISANGGGTFSNIAGATSTTYSFTATVSQSGDKYRAVFTNSAGAATTTAATLTVSKATTTTTVSSSLNPSIFGQSVTFTATLSGGSSPTGTVTFTVDGKAGTPVTLSGTTAAFTTSALVAGPHTVTADYGGDSSNTTSTSATLTQTVNPVVAQDVSAQVTVTRGGYYFNRSRNLLQQVLTLTNTGPALAGPVVVAFDGLPQGVAVFRPDGSTVAALPAGSPYLAAVAPGGALASGGSVMVPVSYYDPAHVPAPYTPRVLAGSGD